MNFSRFLAAGLVVLGLLGLGAECQNPDKATHKTVRIGNGTTLGKANYGIWKADDTASPKCRWEIIRPNGKRIGSGGKHDSVVSATSTKGSKLKARNCGWFYR